MSEEHTSIVNELEAILVSHTEDGWRQLLESSLTVACAKAKDQLNDPAKQHFEPYPDTLDKYYTYLDETVRLIPTVEDYNKEVLFQLCKFYWLLDQPSGRALQDKTDFSDWMVKFAQTWGGFLDTAESLTEESLNSFYGRSAYNLKQYIGYQPESKRTFPNTTWMSFNQFFSREMRNGLRPISGMFDDRIICAPADSVFKEKAKIDDDLKITLKYTHKYNIHQLLDGSPYQDRFRDGAFMHSFLGPADYHRFHAPVRGTVLESRVILGKVYLDVVITDEGDFDAPDGAGYQFTQARGLIIFDSPIGLVAVLPIGMAQVSSVHMTAVEGAYLNKGDEFGHFRMGGSDIILLFEAASNVIISAAPTIHSNVGTGIAEVIIP